MEETTKIGSMKVTKVDGTITNVESEFHIDELFKIIHHMRAKISPDRDALKDIQRMGWPVPQIEKYEFR